MPQVHKCSTCGLLFAERAHFDEHECRPKKSSAEVVNLTDREYCEKFDHKDCYWSGGVLRLPSKGEEVPGTRRQVSDDEVGAGDSWFGSSIYYKASVVRKCGRCGEEVTTWEQVW